MAFYRNMIVQIKSEDIAFEEFLKELAAVNRGNLAEHTYIFLLPNRRHFLVSLSSTALFGGLGIVKDVIFLKISDNLD